ncbi:hypothetical protein GW17_00017120 [Ensete ventricosum]|nr:hypothetical protein GW17_00017120 [Ensete ventricosum]
MSLIRWICSRLLDQVISYPKVTDDIYMRRLPLPVNNRSCGQHCCPCWWQPWPLGLPLAGWPLAVAPYELAVGDRSLRRTAVDRPCGRHAASGYARGRLLPLQGALAAVGHPFAGGLAVASHPCRWPSHGRLPPVIATFAAKI